MNMLILPLIGALVDTYPLKAFINQEGANLKLKLHNLNNIGKIQMNNFLKTTLIAASFLVGSSASAALIKTDNQLYGYTGYYDSVTGLEWLDLSYTAGLTTNQYGTALAGAYWYGGFYLATPTEVFSMLSTNFVDAVMLDALCPAVSYPTRSVRTCMGLSDINFAITAVEEVSEFFGNDSAENGYTGIDARFNGYELGVDIWDGEARTVFMTNDTSPPIDSGSVNAFVYGLTGMSPSGLFTSSNVAYWTVRDAPELAYLTSVQVSEPTTLAVFSLALLGVGFATRRKLINK